MSEANNDYLKEDHFEDDDQEVNISSHKCRYCIEIDATTFEQPEESLEDEILEQIVKNEQKEVVDSISGELENKLTLVLSKITNQSSQEVLKLRMSELALSKILVYTHGKSQFRLVIAHHHIGKAYLQYKCYEQAIDHLTLALKKNSKLADLEKTKLYHSYILTTLSKCYYEIASYEDALEVLSRAEDIQNICFNEEKGGDRCSTETLKLISLCYSKLKSYGKAQEYICKVLSFNITSYGQASKQVAKLQVEKAKIYADQKSYALAIQQLTQSINILNGIKFTNKHQLADLYQLLSEYCEKNQQYDQQIEALFSKIELYSDIYDHAHKNTLKLKRSVAILLIKYQRNVSAIAELEDILEIQEKVYGPNSIHVGKTLKMLGTLFMADEKEINSAEHYLKRAQKILQDQGNVKLVKEIKLKLNSIKESKQKKMNSVGNEPI